VRDFGVRSSARHPKIDILVSSAGYTRPVPHGDLDAMTDELLDAVFIANIRGPFSVIRALAPALRRQRRRRCRQWLVDFRPYRLG
jgi:3-oxoacyl-[acyl-carrier protein] reductase